MTPEYEIRSIDHTFFTNQVGTYVNIVYKHFIHIAQFPELMHTRDEIKRLLTSDKFVGYICVFNNKVVAYVFGEYMVLEDGRAILFINYIWTNKMHRKKNIASELLKLFINRGRNMNVNGIMLITDTHNKMLVEFYSKRGFMIDVFTRRNTQHDVFYQQV